MDDLTPLDARNSLLMDSRQLAEYKGFVSSDSVNKSPMVSRGPSPTISYEHYGPVPARDLSPPGYGSPVARSRNRMDGSRENLVSNAANMAGRDRSSSPKPTLPNIEFGRAF